MYNIEDENYLQIVDNILTNEEFKKLKEIKHHDNNRYDHSLKVSYYSYVIARKLKLNYKEVARAGLLHDFFLDRVANCSKAKDKILLFTTKHPHDAIQNSLKYYDLSDKEKDIIRTHMFPLDVHIPKYMESWVVNMTDKIVSIEDFSLKFKYQLRSATNVYLILLFNFIK